jgi:hypothetical protein
MYSLNKLLYSSEDLGFGEEEKQEPHKIKIDLKETSVFTLKFTLRNLLMAVGRLNSSF